MSSKYSSQRKLWPIFQFKHIQHSLEDKPTWALRQVGRSVCRRYLLKHSEYVSDFFAFSAHQTPLKSHSISGLVHISPYWRLTQHKTDRRASKQRVGWGALLAECSEHSFYNLLHESCRPQPGHSKQSFFFALRKKDKVNFSPVTATFPTFPCERLKGTIDSAVWHRGQAEVKRKINTL